MTESTLQAQIDAAKAYESLFVPALFGQWAPRVANAARIQPGQRVLDVACGTGVLAREAFDRTGPGGHVTGLDPGPGMLAVARELAPQVEWKEGLAESLPFSDNSFDVVVSQFGLMFFSDHRQALREMVRVLSPAGRLAVAVWDSLDHIPAYTAEVALIDQVAGQAAADALRAPFVLGERRELEGLFTDVGLGDVRIATEAGTARFPSVRTMVEADLRGWLPVMGVVLPEEQIAQILERVEYQMKVYVNEQGAVEFGLSAHIVTGAKL